MTTLSKNAPIQENPAHLGFCKLPEWGLIFVEGPDASNFLQNQLTNSVLGLARTPSSVIAPSLAVRLAGYCSPKGRLLASAWLMLSPQSNSSDDRFALFLSKDIAANIAKRLSMYVLRSKVKIVDASNEWNILGHCSSGNVDDGLALDPSQIGLRLPDVKAEGQTYRRVLIAQPKSSIAFDNQNNALTAWNDLEVLSAIPRIVQATQEQFVPQMINFESVAGIDFKKGCYPGQEIVARSQYRGAIKRRLSLAHISKDYLHGAPLNPGVEIFHGDDASQPAGMVVLSGQNIFDSNRMDLQVECKSEALEHGDIRLGSVDGPVLKIDPLPYPLIEI